MSSRAIISIKMRNRNLHQIRGLKHILIRTRHNQGVLIRPLDKHSKPLVIMAKVIIISDKIIKEEGTILNKRINLKMQTRVTSGSKIIKGLSNLEQDITLRITV